MRQLTANLFFASAQRLLRALAFSDVLDDRKETKVTADFEPLARNCDRSYFARFTLHGHLKVANSIIFFQNHLRAIAIRWITHEVKEVPSLSEHFVPVMAKQRSPAIIDFKNDFV